MPIGRASVVSHGSDLTIISYSRMVDEAAQAVSQLAESGISAELIDLRTVAPWDRETVIASVVKTCRAIIVHEAVTPFGAGAEIAAVLNEELFGTLKAPIRRLGGAFCPVPFSKPLETAFAPQAADIAATARALIGQ